MTLSNAQRIRKMLAGDPADDAPHQEIEGDEVLRRIERGHGFVIDRRRLESIADELEAANRHAHLDARARALLAEWTIDLLIETGAGLSQGNTAQVCRGLPDVTLEFIAALAANTIRLELKARGY